MDVINYMISLFEKLKGIAFDIIDFMEYEIFGFPVIYWLLGAGLIGYLTWRIIQATTPL